MHFRGPLKANMQPQTLIRLRLCLRNKVLKDLKLLAFGNYALFLAKNQILGRKCKFKRQIQKFLTTK